MPNLDRTCAALAHSTRRAILVHLRHQDARVTELARPFDLSLNAVSKHLRVLERAGLVRRHIRGREHYFSLHAEPLLEVRDWVESYRRFWEKRVDSLEKFLLSKKRRKRKGVR